MAQKVLQTLDFNSTSKIINLPTPTETTDAATKGYVDSAVEGINWKTSARVATQSNLNISTPGATIDGITIVSGNRILVKAQTSLLENGIYLYDTSSTPLVRSSDANTFSELEQAVISVEEGTNANSTYRQTEINGVLDTNDIVWTLFGTSAPSASESTAGIAEIATQSETDSGTDNSRFITPLKLSTWSGRIRKYSGLIGDGSATSFTLNHNFNTREVQCSVFYNSGNYDEILVEVQRPTLNTITIVFSSAPTSNQFQVVVLG